MMGGKTNQQWSVATTSPLKTLPRPVYCRAYSIPAGTKIEAHRHLWWQFLYARKGMMQVAAEQLTLVIPPEYGMWLPPGCEHSLWLTELVELESLYIRPEILQDLAFTQPRVVILDNFIREFIHHVTCHVPEKYYEKGHDGRKVSVLVDLLKDLPIATLDLPMPRDRALKALCLEMQSRPGDSFLLNDVASKAHMSPRTFSRKFKAETGLSYVSWKQRLKLLSSINLLRAGQSVTSVALSVDYTTPSAYIHAFHSLFGYPPRHFITS